MNKILRLIFVLIIVPFCLKGQDASIAAGLYNKPYYKDKLFFVNKSGSGPVFTFIGIPSVTFQQNHTPETHNFYYDFNPPSIGFLEKGFGESLDYIPTIEDVGSTIVLNHYDKIGLKVQAPPAKMYMATSISVEAPEIVNTDNFKVITQADAPIVLGNYSKPGISGIQFTLDNDLITTFDPSTKNAGTYTVIAKKVYDNGTWTQNINITVVQGTAEIKALGPTTFCQGGKVTLSANDPPSSTITYQYVWSTGESTKDIDVSAPGEYWCTVKNGISSITSNKITVTVNSLPTGQIIAYGPTVVCEGQTVSLSAPSAPAGQNYTYNWSTGETSQNIIARNSATISLTITNGSCSVTLPSVTVTILPKPAPTVTVQGNTDICEGQTTNLISSSGDQYTWYDQNGQVVGASQVLQVIKSGVYKVVVTNNNGCSGESTPVSIVVRPNPIPTIQPNGPLTFCEGGNVILTVSTSDGSTPLAVTWSNGQTGPALIANQSGIFYATITNAGGCQTTSQPVIVTVIPAAKPQILASGPLDICQGQSLTLTATSAVSYLWNTGETTQSIHPSLAGDYYVITTNAGGCQRTSDVIKVTVKSNPIPVLITSGPTTFCEGESIKLTISNPVSTSTYTWSDGVIGTERTVTESGNYYVIANNSGCSAVSQIIAVTVYPIPKPTVAASTDLTICNFDKVTLTINETALGYRWNTGETTRTKDVTTAGSYIAYTINAQGCERASDPVIVSVKDNKFVTVSLSGNTTFCEGDSLILTAMAGASYLWSSGETTQSIKVKRSGTFSVTVTNNVGCSATSADIIVTVNPNPKPVITVFPASTVCEGTDVILTAPLADFYLWSNGANTRSITVKNTQRLSVTTFNIFGCSSTSDIVDITVNPLPVVAITASGPTTFCQGEYVDLTAPAGMTSYLWSNGLQTQTIRVTVGGNYYFTATNQYGCSVTSSSVMVTVNPLPLASITPLSDVEFCKGGSVILQASPGSAYLWSDGSKDATLKVTRSGNYSVTIFNDEGCSQVSQVITVTVNEPTILAKIDNMQICINAGITTLNSENPKGGFYTGNGITQSQFNPLAAGLGIHTITYNYTNANGCFSSTTFTIEVTPLTVLTPNPDTTICITSGELSLDNLSLPDGVVITGTGVSGRRFNPQSSGLGRFIITYTYLNLYGCTSTARQVITVNPNPTAPSVSGNTMGCREDILTLEAFSTITGGTEILYRWYKQGQSESFFTGKILRYNLKATESLFVEAVSVLPGTCTSNMTEVKLITLNPEGNFNVTARVIPQGGFISFTPSVTGAATYRWDFGDGYKSNDASPVHYFNKIGTYTVKMYAYSKEGCSLIIEKNNLVTVEDVSPTIIKPQPNTSPINDKNGFSTNNIYPNPIREGRANVRLYNNKEIETSALLEIYTISGTRLLQKTYVVSPGATIVDLTDLDILTAKTYYLFVIHINGVKESFKILAL